MNDNEPPQPPQDEDAVLTANALKAMAHPLRWRILCTLGDSEMSVGEIVSHIGTSQSNISQHLEQLRDKRIVVSRKEANRVFYRIRNDQLLMLIGTMRSVLCHTNLDDRPPPRDD
jgi:DNA-binding transcriptional ArsR family regulator